jgi:Response regulators consisting of a CheY-like receiver domain and a winged-helix DNA-binding domain
MNRILIVEDSRDVNLMLAQALTDAGYAVASAYTGPQGLDAIKTGGYDLVLLDIMLPYKSGDEILKEMRGLCGTPVCDTPVIIISAKDMVGTKIELLSLGADDYITKPFDLGEVTARVQSNLRRYQARERRKNTAGYRDLTLDKNALRAAAGGAELELTAKEYRILELLVENPDRVFTKASLYESVWQEEYLGDDNAVKTHISNLRSKLKRANPANDYIETVWGLGYRLYKA